MKKILIFIGFLVIILGLIFLKPWKKSEALTGEDIVNELTDPIEKKPQEIIQSYIIQEGDTFTSVMEQLGVSYSDALAIVDAAKDIFDFTSIKLGKEIKKISLNGEDLRLEYEPNSDNVVIVDLKNEFLTEEKPIEYDIEIATANVVIDSSLYLSGLDAGLPEVLILKYADVFAWEVDFATQIQKGDSVTIIYEKRSRNGEDAGVGNVLAGKFVNSGTEFFAYRFEGDDDSVGYYDKEGNSLIRPFLKAPVSYSRITSGYSTARFHPTLKRTTPHRAIDYAAPMGTPVMAVGDGKIVWASWNGGYGNFIKLRHNEKFETHYAHLSKYAVKVGDVVKQGDIIGYVGSTGFSTGPHVHYEVQVNGQLVNPLEVEFPKGDAISSDKMEEFYKTRDELDKKF